MQRNKLFPKTGLYRTLRRCTNSAYVDISFECDIFLSWITATNLQWHKTKDFCSERVMGLISLLEQFLAILNILHLFSIQLISPKTFLTHSHFSEDAKETIFNRFNHTKNIFPPCKLLYLRKISRHLRSQKDLKSNKVKKVKQIKIFTSIVKYQKNWDISTTWRRTLI